MTTNDKPPAGVAMTAGRLEEIRDFSENYRRVYLGGESSRIGLLSGHIKELLTELDRRSTGGDVAAPADLTADQQAILRSLEDYFPDAHSIFTTLAAKLKAAERERDEAKDELEGSMIAADELTTAWKHRAATAEAKLTAAEAERQAAVDRSSCITDWDAIYAMMKRDGWYASSEDDVDLAVDVEVHLQETARTARSDALEEAAKIAEGVTHAPGYEPPLPPSKHYALGFDMGRLAAAEAIRAKAKETR